MFERQTLQNQAYDYLFKTILENGFEDGVMYSESQLSEALNISRTPIHSALQRLQMEGYVDIYPSRGFQLHAVTKEDLREAFQTCIAQEGYSAFCLAESPACASTLQELQACIDRQARCEAQGDIPSFMEEDRRFHGCIINSLQNGSFQLAFTIYRYKIGKFLVESLSKPGAISNSVKEHRAILKAISDNDITMIFQLLQQHHNDF